MTVIRREGPLFGTKARRRISTVGLGNYVKDRNGTSHAVRQATSVAALDGGVESSALVGLSHESDRV